jgi:hypothetical protein
MNLFADHPGLQQFAMYATLWALVCIGICLPLITLKLYWNSIKRLFPRESAYHEFDRSLSPPPASKPVPPTPPASAENKPNHP